MLNPRIGHLALFAPFVLATPAVAQWTENFDSYPNGSSLEGNFGDWEGWNGVNTNLSVITNLQASNPPHSVQVNTGADTVHPFLGFNTGQWVVSVDQFVPQDFVGKTFFIILNKYNVTSQSYEWAVQIGMNGDNDLVECDCGSTTPVTLPLIRGQWVEIVAEIDLDADVVTVKYGGTTLATYPWSSGATGSGSFNMNRIRAINLYSDAVNFPHVTEVFFDNFSLQPGQGGGGIGTNYCTSTSNSSGTPATLAATGSTSVAANNFVLSASPVPNTTGLFFYSANQAQIPFGNGFQCVTAPIARLDVVPISGGVLTAAVDLTAPVTLQTQILPGTTWNFQAWFMDPAGGGAGFNTSDALTVTFQ